MLYKTTVFNTPIVSFSIRIICRLSLWIAGWKIEGNIPKQQSCVLIAIPHRSNWDFPITLSIFFLCKWKVYWFGKKEMFYFPLKSFFKWMGGIPVDRSIKNDLVNFAVDLYTANDNLMIMITPEGTRKKVQKWKTGFYHIATKANVPILLGNLNYEKKVARIIGIFEPTDNYEEDLEKIQNLYSNFL